MDAAHPASFPCLNILGARIASGTYAEAVEIILARAQENRPGAYVCATNVHCVSMARRNASYRGVLNGALLSVPDGMPLIWGHGFLGGRPLTDRVYGPTLMRELCAAAAARGLPIYLYGGAPGVPEKLAHVLRERLPSLQIAGVYSPDFNAKTNDPAVLQKIDEINASGARLLFVALGAPKQEYFMAQHTQALVPVQVGVGAAFNFHTGTVRQAPAWMQGAGLEWMYRFCHEPRRLWKRYLFYNPYFLARLGLQRAGPDGRASNAERMECPSNV